MPTWSSTLSTHRAVPRVRLAEFYTPGRARDFEADRRREKFAEVNEFIRERDGWVVSIRGEREIVFECLPGSMLPDELKAAGYPVVPADPPEGERILASGITERLTLTSSGAYAPLVEGSTAPVALVKHHAGITRVLRYGSDL